MGIHRVDDISFDAGQLMQAERTSKYDHLGGGNQRAVLAGEDLHALGGGVGPLVELARQVFHGEGGFIFCQDQRVAGRVDLWLR